jgi:hypothetical protein
MPTITISMPASRMHAADAEIDGFIEATVKLCMDIMEVPSDKVHLTFVPVHLCAGARADARQGRQHSCHLS